MTKRNGRPVGSTPSVQASTSSVHPAMLCAEKVVIRDTVRFLGFTQLVLIFCSGAIPNPFRILAFAPLLVLTGAGTFWAVSRLVWLFSNAAKPAPGATNERTPEHSGEVLAFPKSA